MTYADIKPTSVLSYALDCTYPRIDLKPWSTLGTTPPTTAFKHLNNHEIECTGKPITSLFGGFIREQTPRVKQDWTSLTYVFPFLQRCVKDLAGSYQEYRAWYGSVRIGAYQIAQLCRDSDAVEGSDEKSWAVSCWKKVKEDMNPSSVSYTTWVALESTPEGLALPVQIILDAAQGKLTDDRYSKHWLHFESLVATAGLTRSVNNPREAFRSTFGWGYDLIRTAIDNSRWQTTSNALQNAQILTAGTQHRVEMRCSVGDSVAATDYAPENYRDAGMMNFVPIWSKFVNGAVTLSFLLLNLAAFTIPDSRPAHFVLGVLLVLLLAVLWVFESAVSSQVLVCCFGTAARRNICVSARCFTLAS